MQLIPIGIQSCHSVTDTSLKSSSNWDTDHSETRSRLHYNQSPGSLSWCAKVNDNTQWIQVSLPNVTTIAGIATQGRGDLDQWVTKYEVLYNDTGSESEFIRYPKVLSGNYDRYTAIINPLKPFRASVIRIRPLEWHAHISLRWEVYTSIE